MNKKIWMIIVVCLIFTALAGCRRTPAAEPTEVTEMTEATQMIGMTETVDVTEDAEIPEETEVETKSVEDSFFEGEDLPDEEPTTAEGETEASEDSTKPTKPPQSDEKDEESGKNDSQTGSSGGYADEGDMLEPPENDSSIELD